MEYRELTDAFAAKYGMAKPPGEGDVETVEIDGTRVTFREDPKARAVILSAQVGEMPPDEKGRFASILLKASGLLSANGEGAFCVDDDDVFHAVRSIPLAHADADGLTSALESLVDLAEIGYPPPDSNGRFGEMMLKANHLFLGTNGGTLCQNPETDAYVLMRPVPLAPLEGEEAVGAILEETLAQVERWRQNLNGMREAESTLDSQVAEERAAFGSGAFIQV